jgi:hypothetical protein
MEPTPEVSRRSVTLADQKLQEEVLQLRASRRQTALQLYVEVSKSIMLFVAASLAFLLITRPDSLTSRTSSEEEMRRERARLVIDVIKERDPEIVLAGLMVIRKSYPPADAEWIQEIEEDFTSRSTAVSQLITRREEMVRTRDQLTRRLSQEANGTAGSGVPGYGPVYAALQLSLVELEKQIAELDRMLLFYRGR